MRLVPKNALKPADVRYKAWKKVDKNMRNSGLCRNFCQRYGKILSKSIFPVWIKIYKDTAEEKM